jgi:hypothetical protein
MLAMRFEDLIWGHDRSWQLPINYW